MILNTERMTGCGEYLVDGYQVNFLYGLNDICKKFLNKDKILLELGSNNGVSTQLFSEYVNTVVSVDLVLTDNMKNVLEHNKNIMFYNMYFLDFFKQNKETFDFIYIDGSHCYEDVKTDIKNCQKILKTDGIISGHDYNSKTIGVIEATNEIFGKNNIEIFSDSSWVYKKL
jgi:predicted O-methyltransferase YrrM